MKKVNLTKALRLARLITLPEEATRLSVDEARHKIIGEMLHKMLEGHGVKGDEYFDVFIVKHWVNTLQQLDDLTRKENLENENEVTIIYNEETDTYDIL